MKVLTHAFAVLVAISMLGLPSAGFAKAKTKKLNQDDLHIGIMTFDQVARLSHARRKQYISSIRQAARDIDQFQRMFKGAATTAMLDNSSDQYALNFLLGTYADAADVAWKNQCLYAGNISSYPVEKGGDESRVAFECKIKSCQYGSVAKGVLCNYTYSGLTNNPDVGCLPIDKQNNAINKAFASQACWDQREMLATKNSSDVAKIMKDSNAYFFEKEYDPTQLFDENNATARDLITKLVKTAYSDDSYAQLVKIAYFYKSQGKNFPKGVENFNGEGEAGQTVDKVNKDSNDLIIALKDDFTQLNQAADRIFAAHVNHCATILPNDVIRDIKTGKNLSRVGVGTSAHELEKDRQEYLAKVCNLSAKPTAAELSACQASHENVLEVKECELVKLRFDNLKKKLTDIAGDYPRIKNGEPPPKIPTDPSGPDDRLTDVKTTGCSENITRQETNLTQPAARCMACMIQTHESQKAKDPSLERDAVDAYTSAMESNIRSSSGKRKEQLQSDLDHVKKETLAEPGTFRASRKYLSLVQTMALACGDGLTNDSTVNPEVMMDYWYAFGHCSSTTYEWTGGEEKGLVQKWGDKTNHWNRAPSKDAEKYKNNAKKNPENPDYNKNFLRSYGLSFETATKLFCDPERFDFTFFRRRKGFTKKEWDTNKGSLLKKRREQFAQNKAVINRGEEDSPADNLMKCFAEAQKNTMNFNTSSNMCSAVKPFPVGGTQDEKNAKAVFLTDAPMLIAGDDCYIPKQLETWDVKANGKPCYDNLADKYNVNKQKECVGKDSAAVWVNPASNNLPDSTPEGQRRYSSAPNTKDYTPDVAILSSSKVQIPNLKITYLSNEGCPISKSEAKNTATKGRGKDK